MKRLFLAHTLVILLALLISPSSSNPLVQCNQGTDCMIFSAVEENDRDNDIKAEVGINRR